MTYPFAKRILYSAYRLSSRHLAPDGSDKIVHGTCFFVDSAGALYLVTNRHNVNLSYAAAKYVGYKWDGMHVAGYFNADEYIECDFAHQKLTFGHPLNDAEDVIAVDVTATQFMFKRKRRSGEDPNTQTKNISPISVGIDMLASDEEMKSLSAGAQIFFPSYPEQYDFSGVRPLMRAGIISSDPESDYRTSDLEPARRIACQAHSTQGSSGAPVYAVKSETEVILLGINAGHLVGEEPRIGTIHSGLSYCYKTSCIREAIENSRGTR
jgi:hypothetical protein